MEEKSSSSLRHYIVEHVCGRNLVQPPGTGFSYSNPGYIVAGRLIETVTGMSWSEAVESILLRPLGIEPAFVNPPGTIPSRRQVATGHSVNTAVGRIRPVRQELVPAFAPAAALAVSAVDMVKLGLIHVGQGRPEVLPAAYARQMRRAVPRADPFGLADGWGPGLAVYWHQPAEWVGHDGNAQRNLVLRADKSGRWMGGGAHEQLQHRRRPVAGVSGRTGPCRRSDQSAPNRDAGRAAGRASARLRRPVHQRRYPVHGEGGQRWGRLPVCRWRELCSSGLLREPYLYLFGTGSDTSLGQASAGRFVRNPATGKIYGIHVSGRLARRR